MTFTDTHNHCYAGEFDADRPAMIRRAIDAGVSYMFLPAIDSGHTDRLLEMAGNYPQHCFPMMGLHPTSVRENYPEELAHVEEMLAKPGVIFYAIGEIGIDLYWDRTFEQQQVEVFRRQLKLAVEYDLPVVIHTRNSMDIALQIVSEWPGNPLRGIFHCFSGNAVQAAQAIRLGFKLGIGGVITYRNSGLQKVVEHTPVEHLVLETDAPWLPPVPHRGERNEPSYIPLIAQKIAEIKNLSLETVAEITTNNAVDLFRIDR